MDVSVRERRLVCSTLMVAGVLVCCCCFTCHWQTKYQITDMYRRVAKHQHNKKMVLFLAPYVHITKCCPDTN